MTAWRDSALGPVRLWELPAGAQCLVTLLAPAAWVGLEWLRGWIFTGFPWNQLGISQWHSQGLLPLVTVTGVYGISFLIVAVNLAVAFSWARLAARFYGRMPGFTWPLLVVLLLFLPVEALRRLRPPTPPPDGLLTVLAVQGNIPQCRVWSQQQLDESLNIYTGLTRQGLRTSGHPDLVLWPETAVPAPARFDKQYWQALSSLFPELGDAQLLLGSIDLRPELRPTPPPPPPGPNGKTAPQEDEMPVFNSAMLFSSTGRILERYDKMHLVPFGEYTPFGRYLPWLENWIGMGRGLTAGREPTLFLLPPNATPAGVMICFEDAFPGIARTFAQRGAKLLITITNDAWYAESAGSRQHMLHAVFRAVETGLPLMRAGNNSDTCLILPDGRITAPLTDPATGSPFYRGFKTYEIPIQTHPAGTWYARHGDVFAGLCAAVLAGLAAWLARAELQRKARLCRMTEAAR